MTARHAIPDGTAAPRRASIWRHPLWWLSIAYTPILLWAELGPSWGPLETTVADWVGYLPLLLPALWSTWQAARGDHGLHPETRRALGLIAAAVALWTVGNLGYTWTYMVQEAGFDAWSLGEPFFVAGYLVMLLGLLKLPSRHPRRYPGWQAVLDTLIVVVGSAALGWDLIVQPTLEGTQGLDYLLVRAVYPAFGAAYLLAINATRGGGGPLEHRRAWRWLAVAISAYAVADGFYQLVNYTSGWPEWYWWASDGLYILAYLGIQRAGWEYRRPDASAMVARSGRPLTFSPLPIAAVAGVLVLLLVRASGNWEPGVSELGLALAVLVVLLLIRQHRTSLENDRLERIRLERDGEVRAAAMLRHARALVLLTDAEQRVHFTSPNVEALLGMPTERLLGTPLTTLVHPGDMPRLREALRDSGPSGGGPVDLRLLCADGTHRELDVIATDLTHEPAVHGIVLFARDMSEKRALEIRLRQAEKMEVVGRLAGGVAHDFNNLLTTILAESEMLLDDPAAPAAIGTIREAAQLGAGLTHQLLTFSRQQAPAARAVDVEELIRGSLRLLGKVDTIIRVQSRVEPALHRAFVDAQQIQQVVLNLLFNARDAMPAGGTLTVAAENVRLDRTRAGTPLPTAAGEHVRITVSDSGVGMEPEVLRRAFEPFFTTKPAGKGTGLGLASVLGTLQQHGAGLHIESAPGQGTRVEVDLPRDPGPQPGAAAVQREDGTLPLGHERVLVVDDEPAVLDVTRRSLERLGYEVQVAADAAQAEALLAGEWRPAVLITDVIMPEVSGPQLVARLRPSWPDLPVLYISGFTGEELTEGGDLVPGEAFLAKPYTPIELGVRLRALLDRDQPE
jgi:PAS domain S-box-containing protein